MWESISFEADICQQSSVAVLPFSSLLLHALHRFERLIAYYQVKVQFKVSRALYVTQSGTTMWYGLNVGSVNRRSDVEQCELCFYLDGDHS